MVETTFKQTEIGLIPEDWEIKIFTDVFYFLSTASYSRAEMNESEKIGYIHYGDIHTKINNHLDINKFVSGYISKKQALDYALIEKGDLIMADASEDYSGVGKSFEVVTTPIRRTISGLHTFLIRDKGSHFASKFKGYLHSNPLIKKQYDALATGLKVYSLSKNVFQNILIPLPPLPEQQVIAEVLSDTDTWIECLEKLIAKKRLIKQGAMQELLTPKEDCEVRKLGEILRLQGGYAFNSSDFKEFGVNVIRISDINGKIIDLKNATCVNIENIPVDFCVNKNDVLIAMSGATTGKIGKYNYTRPAYINQRVGKFDIYKKNKYSIQYLYHIIQTNDFRDQMNKMLAQGAQPNISGGQIESIIFSFPPLLEQNRIATILSDMDAEIEALENKLSKARQIKQGMMQELLTGRIRLI